MNFVMSEEFYYSNGGEWIQVDENLVTTGLTDFRLHQLGEVLFLDLPDEGKLVRQGDTFFSIESVKKIHDFTSPVTGTIMEVNRDLYDNPSLLNDDPFSSGWLVKIEMDNEKDLALLMRSIEYRKRLLDEGSGLSKMIS